MRAYLSASRMHVEVDVRVHRRIGDFSLIEQLEPSCFLCLILFYDIVIKPIAILALLNIGAEFWKRIVQSIEKRSEILCLPSTVRTWVEK